MGENLNFAKRFFYYSKFEIFNIYENKTRSFSFHIYISIYIYEKALLKVYHTILLVLEKYI